MLFRQDADGRDVELSGSTVALGVELQRRVEAGLEQMLGIRFLASEYSTGPWHRGRIDTLGLDENGSPVVIEFKKGSDSGVLSQAVSYMAWLKSTQHEFEALVRKVLGAEAAESINWRRPRMVCIAAGFSRHDRVAVQRVPERIDLVRYRVFEGGLLSLLLVDSSPGVPSTAPRRSRARDVAAEDRDDPSFGHTERQFLWHLGNAWTHLGRTEDAWQVQRRVLDLYPPTEYLDPTLIRLDRATCLARSGEPGGGLPHRHAGPDGTVGRASHRHGHEVRHRLQPHRRTRPAPRREEVRRAAACLSRATGRPRD
ncbi:hypothetical protein ABZ318_23305 [Streptomyces sp. NPDC006197]|uniref:hypothetical protein n=1 Tax=Streptomyces sp. NPDC006197 TaxID=3156685 RepID=UPI0033BC94CD